MQNRMNIELFRASSASNAIAYTKNMLVIIVKHLLESPSFCQIVSLINSLKVVSHVPTPSSTITFLWATHAVWFDSSPQKSRVRVRDPETLGFGLPFRKPNYSGDNIVAGWHPKGISRVGQLKGLGI